MGDSPWSDTWRSRRLRSLEWQLEAVRVRTRELRQRMTYRALVAAVYLGTLAIGLVVAYLDGARWFWRMVAEWVVGL